MAAPSGVTGRPTPGSCNSQAEKQILADAPVIPLYFYRDYRIMDKRVLGQQHDPMGSEDMNLVWVGQ